MTTAVPAAVLVLAWLRLESPVTGGWTIAAIVVVALAAAFVRPRWASVPVAALLAVRLAFGQWPNHLGRAASRFSNGFLDFYDVRTPFDPRVHVAMHGVILVAIFGFALLVSLAIATRRLVPALGGVLVGAGWPATLEGTGHTLLVGAAVLAAALLVLAGLTERRVPRALVPAVGALVLCALAASASSGIAKPGLVAWQQWDFYTAPAAPVSVQFAWNADYTGIAFPKRRTRVLEIEAPPRSLFWRAAVLDRFDGDKWIETDPLAGDALEPEHRDASDLVRQKVHVVALDDTRLVGASEPVSFDAGDAPLDTRAPGFARLETGLPEGFAYTVTSYAPRPTAADLERSGAVYPGVLTRPGAFLDVWPGVTAPAFGKPRRTLLDTRQDIVRYAPILNAALAVSNSASTPYEATMRILRWFLVSGGFRYTSRPAIFSDAPLVGFVAETRAGYCQQFAGAMALMLRYLGIPARVAVGFSSGRYDAKRHRWLVSDHDAHAWVEAWFRGYGWLPFDPTPSGRPEQGTLSAPYAHLTTAASGGGAGPVASIGADSSKASGHRHGETGTAHSSGLETPAIVRPHRHGSLVLLLLAVVAAICLAVAGTKVALRRVRYVTRNPRRVAAACREELAAYLLDQSIEGARSATLHELGALVRHELAVDADAFVAA
ncbi:MAG: transglutaminaseTgpA domain-containing protein, partial [Actinomycetota bacterium]